MIILVCPVCAVIGVVLIRIMVSLALRMCFARNSVSVFCHNHSPFVFSILSHSERALAMNHVVQKTKDTPQKGISFALMPATLIKCNSFLCSGFL